MQINVIHVKRAFKVIVMDAGDIITYGYPYKLPELTDEFLEVTLICNEETSLTDTFNEDFPFIDSEIYSDSCIISSRRLTCSENVKEVYSIELPSHGRSYQPGDTVAIIPNNPDEDLSCLFKALRVDNLVYKKCKVIQKNKDVKLKVKPRYLDRVTTLYEIFKNEVDIQCLPKKSLIRIMVDYTKNEIERHNLAELCSKEGTNKYESEILDTNLTFLDFLQRYPSCCLPVARLLEHLPALQPRPYSIASSPLSSPNGIQIVFSVIKTQIKDEFREGICTGMMKTLIKAAEEDKLNKKKIKMFYRRPNGFRLPDDNTIPLILIGPGTGLAPFIGFLEHRKMQNVTGTIWLFYGCRYELEDFLFKEELYEYLECGALTKLSVSFSREPGQNARYVQDNIKKYGKDVCDIICDKKGIIYVCGDAKGMRKDVMNTFVEIFQTHKGLNEKEAAAFVRTLQKEKRYLQDVWF